jgi:hypothetical protein
MRTVIGPEGKRYLLVKQSSDASRVRDPETGEERYLPNADLELAGESALETAARAVPEPLRRALSAVHSDRALGLLLELDARGPVAVRDLLASYDLCESDLHGQLGEFRAAGLIEEARIAGERGYDTTPLGAEAVALLRG